MVSRHLFHLFSDNGRVNAPSGWARSGAMKVKTALKQAMVSVKFLSLVIPVTIVLAIKYPSGYTIVPLVVFAAYFCMDVLTIRRIRHKAAQDPSYLDQRLK